MEFETIKRLARRQANVVSVRQCRSAGVPASTLADHVARGLLDRPHRGVLTLPGADPDDAATRCWTALCAVGSPAWIGGLAALAIRGLAAPPDVIDVVVPRDRKPSPPDGARLRRLVLTPADCGRSGTTPVLTVGRALHEAAVHEAYDEVLGAAAAGVQRGSLDLDGLEAATARLRTGARVMRSVVADLRGTQAQSLLAHRVTLLVRSAGFEVDAEVPVRIGPGRIAVLDLAVRGTRVAIEVDGHAIHSGRRALAADRRRQNLVRLTDRVVLRVDWHRLRTDGTGFLAELRAAAEAHPAR